MPYYYMYSSAKICPYFIKGHCWIQAASSKLWTDNYINRQIVINFLTLVSKNDEDDFNATMKHSGEFIYIWAGLNLLVLTYLYHRL